MMWKDEVYMASGERLVSLSLDAFNNAMFGHVSKAFGHVSRALSDASRAFNHVSKVFNKHSVKGRSSVSCMCPIGRKSFM